MDQPSAARSRRSISAYARTGRASACTGHHCCMPVMEAASMWPPPPPECLLLVLQLPRGSRCPGGCPEADFRPAAAEAISRRVREFGPRPRSKPWSIPLPPLSAGTVERAADRSPKIFTSWAMPGAARPKNEYVMDLGSKVPHLFELLKQVTERVPGCMSQVYLVARQKPSANGEKPLRIRRRFRRGNRPRSHRHPASASIPARRRDGLLAFDIEAFFHRIGLEQFIPSPSAATDSRNGGQDSRCGEARSPNRQHPVE